MEQRGTVETATTVDGYPAGWAAYWYQQGWRPAVAAPAPPAPPAPAVSTGDRSRLPRWLPTLGLAAAFVVLLFAGFGPAGGLLVGFALITPIERLFRRHQQPIRRPGLRTDMFHLLFSGGLTTVFTIIPIALWAIVLMPVNATNAMPALFASQPLALQAIEAFVLFEVMGYFGHRALHEVPAFWRYHAVHHSSERLDWIAGARNHPIDGMIVGAIIAPPLLLIGVTGATLGLFTLVVNLWGVFLHANVRWRLRFLDGIWGTPEYHHWHHSNHGAARNKNYAAFLPVLDRVFGTYYQPKDHRPEVYGIDDPMPDGWLRQMIHPFRRRDRRAGRDRSMPRGADAFASAPMATAGS